MEAPLIATKNLYLQKTFAANSAQWIKSLFGAAADETLLCAVWINPILRYGFVVSDKAVRWRLPADEKPVTGFVLKQLSPQAEFRIHEEGSMLRLEMAAADTTFSFFFRALAIEKSSALCDILRYGFAQGTVPQTDLGVLVKNMPFAAARNVFDGVLNKLADLWKKLNRKLKAKKETKKNPKASPDGQKSTQDKKQQTSKAKAEKKHPIFLFVLDLLASLAYLIACFVKAKDFNLPFLPYMSCLIWYGCLRLPVILLAKNGMRKIISLLLMALLVVCNLFILTILPYSIFTLFCILLYFCLEYSFGLRTRTILIKLLLIIPTGLFLYLYMLAAGAPEVEQAIDTILGALPLKKVRLPWSKLF